MLKKNRTVRKMMLLGVNTRKAMEIYGKRSWKSSQEEEIGKENERLSERNEVKVERNLKKSR